MKNTEDIFTKIYDTNMWKNKESKSGGGSTLKANKFLLDLLEKFCIGHNIKTFADLACGDFNWMKHFNFDVIEQYIGYDIVKFVIDDIKRYENEKISFKYINIVSDPIKQADLLLLKDCLFHLNNDEISKVIENVKRSNSKYLLTTTFVYHDNIAIDINTGSWRPINLCKYPYNLPTPDYIWINYENRNDNNKDKSIGIWKIKNL